MVLFSVNFELSFFFLNYEFVFLLHGFFVLFGCVLSSFKFVFSFALLDKPNNYYSRKEVISSVPRNFLGIS